MTAAYRIQSVCECQALLSAELNDDRQVLAAWSQRGRDKEVAPANTLGAKQDRFDVAWMCPLCGRNTLRTFYAGALERVAPATASDADVSSAS